MDGDQPNSQGVCGSPVSPALDGHAGSELSNCSTPTESNYDAAQTAGAHWQSGNAFGSGAQLARPRQPARTMTARTETESTKLSVFLGNPVSKALDTFSKISHMINHPKDDSLRNERKEEYKNFLKQNMQKQIVFEPPVLPGLNPRHKVERLPPLAQDEFDASFVGASKEQLLQRVFLGGIASNELRKKLWPVILGIHRSVKDSSWNYLKIQYLLYAAQWSMFTLDQETRFSAFKERKSLVERDVVRCDRTHDFYKDENDHIKTLKEVLMSYVMYDFDIGYVQGMTDLLAPILYVYDGNAAKAFWCFVEVLKTTRNNFEPNQKTIQFQLEMLFKLIHITDPYFAQYLNKNKSANCYFAFRWIICLFKREFAKGKNLDYNNCLIVWETIWSLNALQKLKNEENYEDQDAYESNSLQRPYDTVDRELLKEESETLFDKYNNKNLSNRPFGVRSDSCSSKDNKRRLTDVELFYISMCLSIIRRERNYIMAKHFDQSEILKHFNNLKLDNDLNIILTEAINIWNMIKDENLEEDLYSKDDINDPSNEEFYMLEIDFEKEMY